MTAEVKTQDDDETPPSFLCSFRLGLSVLGFFVFLHNNMQRVSMSVAIICMVNHTAVQLIKDADQLAAGIPYNTSYWNNSLPELDVRSSFGNDSVEEVPLCQSDDVQETLQDGPFDWDKGVQGHILGAYFYGYLISQVPAGMLAERFGPKWPLMIFYMIATVATLLTPVAAFVSPILLIVLRILIGLGSGALFPCMHVMYSKWAPPLERSKLAGITHAGCMAAAMVGLPLSGVLCKYGFGQGWDSIFYVIGSCSFVVILLWVVLASDSPSENPRVSTRERRYIVNSLKGEGTMSKQKHNLPWCEVLKSGPVWAIIVANFCSDWGLYTLLTNIPTFLNEVLKFNIQSNGIFSALPFMGLWINMNVSPIIADKLRSSRTATTTTVRKIFNTIGLIAPAIFLCGLGFVECTQPVIGIALLTFGVTLSGCAYTGFLVNHMDIGPKYAGTLMGISNGLGAMSGFIAPSVAAALTPNRTRLEWQTVFFVASGVYVFGAIFYLIFGSGSIQSWAIDEDDLEPEEIDLKSDHATNGNVLHVNADKQNGDLTATNEKSALSLTNTV